MILWTYTASGTDISLPWFQGICHRKIHVWGMFNNMSMPQRTQIIHLSGVLRHFLIHSLVKCVCFSPKKVKDTFPSYTHISVFSTNKLPWAGRRGGRGVFSYLFLLLLILLLVLELPCFGLIWGSPIHLCF